MLVRPLSAKNTPTDGVRIADGAEGARNLHPQADRTPGTGVHLADSGRTNMENYGVQPDIFVDNTPEDNLASRDRQLEVAVSELMKQLPTTKPAPQVAGGSGEGP